VNDQVVQTGTLFIDQSIYISKGERVGHEDGACARSLLSVCGRCLFGGLGCCSCRVCVGVGGVVLCRCVCVCVCV